MSGNEVRDDTPATNTAHGNDRGDGDGPGPGELRDRATVGKRETTSAPPAETAVDDKPAERSKR